MSCVTCHLWSPEMPIIRKSLNINVYVKIKWNKILGFNMNNRVGYRKYVQDLIQGKDCLLLAVDRKIH